MPPRLLAGIAAAVTLVCCGPRSPALRAPYTDVHPTNITAIELRKTTCYGRCPAFTLRLTSDGVAHYVGDAYAPRAGTFTARVDFERLASWVDSQQPETLAGGYGMNWVDTPETTVVVERGTRKTVVSTRNMAEAPVRFEGLALALTAVSDHLRWKRLDDLSPYVGDFANGRSVIHGIIHGQQIEFYGRPEIFGCPSGDYAKTRRLKHAVRVWCGRRSSRLSPAPAGLRAEGDLIAPGLYQRVTVREADRLSGLLPAPEPSRHDVDAVFSGF